MGQEGYSESRGGDTDHHLAAVRQTGDDSRGERRIRDRAEAGHQHSPQERAHERQHTDHHAPLPVVGHPGRHSVVHELPDNRDEQLHGGSGVAGVV